MPMAGSIIAGDIVPLALVRDFYPQFEEWRVIALKNPDKAFARRPPLVNIGE